MPHTEKMGKENLSTRNNFNGGVSKQIDYFAISKINTQIHDKICNADAKNPIARQTKTKTLQIRKNAIRST